ncbi:MAG: hypothetical protein HQL52_04470 [Magnetococcales bacterium]|nr:hypothetical protein [Magnetococcales bacterium]
MSAPSFWNNGSTLPPSTGLSMAGRMGLFLAGFFLASLFPLQAQAETLELRRFFTTPGERSRLDFTRRMVQSGQSVTSNEESDSRGLVSFDGLFWMEGSQPTVWINGEEYKLADKKASDWLSLSKKNQWDSRVWLDLPDAVAKVRLKPGQAMDRISGSVLETYQVYKENLLQQRRLQAELTAQQESNNRLKSPMNPDEKLLQGIVADHKGIEQINKLLQGMQKTP